VLFGHQECSHPFVGLDFTPVGSATSPGAVFDANFLTAKERVYAGPEIAIEEGQLRRISREQVTMQHNVHSFVRHRHAYTAVCDSPVLVGTL